MNDSIVSLIEYIIFIRDIIIKIVCRINWVIYKPNKYSRSKFFMKYLWILIISFIVCSPMAQTQILEGGFNNWTFFQKTYYEPTGGWWTSLNTLSALGGPVTVSPTTDVHSGTNAAKLETKKWGTFLLPGLLASGSFIMSAPYVKEGKPFTDMPYQFKGWYKYSPVNGDSAAIATFLTKYNTVTGKQDTIAKAIQVLKGNVSEYTQFNLNYDYKSGMNPDTIIIVFVSSAAGGNSSGQVGSTLFIDDIYLEYGGGLQEILMPEFTTDVYPSPASKQIQLRFNTISPEQIICKVFAIDGQFMQSFSPLGNTQQIDVSNWPQSSYIAQVWLSGRLVSSTKFLVAH